MLNEISMSLPEWLSYIEQCHPSEIDMSLERVRKVGQRAGVLSFSCPVITVAGTNGKGSTVFALGKLLQSAGLTVGTYSSPHLIHFNERIQINGRSLSDEKLCEAFAIVEEFREQTPLTFFEFTTLAAWVIFQQLNPLDVVILEVGLGGRLDAVNCVDPTLAVITAIGMDHQDLLGKSIEKIAEEKAGILRPNKPVVLSSQSHSVVLAKAKQLNNQIYQERYQFGYLPESQYWHFDEQAVTVPSHGLPENSVSLAMAAYTILAEKHLTLPPLKEIVNFLENLQLTGRFTTMSVDDKTIILDVGHNPDAAEWLNQQLQRMTAQGKIFAVWASLADKDLKKIVDPLLAHIQTWCVGGLEGVKRSASTTMLCRILQEQGASNVMEYKTISNAFDAAFNLANSGDCILVFGSFYTVSEVLKKFKNPSWKN